MKIVFKLIFCLINVVGCLGEFKSTILLLSAKENALSSTSGKPVLRYGFHRTEECKSFEKAYICIQKCIDLNYDVAHADKHCQCTCYVKQERAKYKPSSQATKTRWRSGAPTTSIPYWAKPLKENKTRDDEGSASGEADDATGTEKLNGDATGVTDSTNQEGGTGGDDVTGATNADGGAGTGGTDSTNTGPAGDATGAADAAAGGEATPAADAPAPDAAAPDAPAPDAA